MALWMLLLAFSASQVWDGIFHLAGDDMPPLAIMDGFPNGITLGNVWQLARGPCSHGGLPS